MLTATTRRATLGASLLLTVAFGGCGGDDYPSYGAGKACGVGADRVAAVLGTDHFQVAGRGSSTLPAANMDCHVDLKPDDYDLAVIVAPVDATTLAEQEAKVAASKLHFAHGDGRIGITVADDDFTGVWICQDMRAYVTASVGDDYTAADGRNLMTSMADAVGCDIPD